MLRKFVANWVLLFCLVTLSCVKVPEIDSGAATTESVSLKPVVQEDNLRIKGCEDFSKGDRNQKNKCLEMAPEGQGAKLINVLEMANKLGDVKRAAPLLALSAGDSAKFDRLTTAVTAFELIPSDGKVVKLHGYNGANIKHFEGRHTFEHFDFIGQRIKADNTFWPKGTDVSQKLEEALVLLDKEVPPFKLVPFSPTAKRITLANKTVVQLAVDDNNVLAQFFPVKETGEAVNFVQAEMEAFKQLLIP